MAIDTLSRALAHLSQVLIFFSLVPLLIQINDEGPTMDADCPPTALPSLIVQGGDAPMDIELDNLGRS